MADAVVVVIPAHNEAAGLRHTLVGVRRAITVARRAGDISTGTVQVVAHRCTDGSAHVARAALGDRGAVFVDDVSSTVGRARDLGVRLALGRADAGPGTWVLSTDADTRVPRTWITDVLSAARRHRADAVVGLAPVAGWHAGRGAGAAYADIIANGMRAGSGLHQHDHVYGANLAARAEAYLTVGGYPDVAVGEDAALVASLVATGHRVLRSREVRVATSARTQGRASGGLADLIARLAHPAEDCGEGASPRADHTAGDPGRVAERMSFRGRPLGIARR